jgi:hypothetical protein
MNVLIKTATALGFILAIPLFALSAHSAPAYEACHTGGETVSHVRRLIPKRPRCPGNYSRDIARNHQDRKE